MMKKGALIGAVAPSAAYGIGRGDKGKIPWNVPLDMQFFAATTKGDGHNAVAMSRGMWSSLPVKFRPLSGRENIIVTGNSDLIKCPPPGAKVAMSTAQAFQCSRSERVFFAGGQDMWYNARDLVDELYINVVHTEVEGEDIVSFPHLLDPTMLWPEFSLQSDPRFATCVTSRVVVEFRTYARSK